MTQQQSQNILELRQIVKSFLGVTVLDKVDFAVRRGTVHALIGENGAGKSTLMKIVSGIYQPDSGEIYYDGIKREALTPSKAIDMGVSMIHQELSPVPEMSVAENIFLGREPMKNRFLIDYDRMYKETRQLFESVGVNYNPAQPIKELSVADMQMIEITKAISHNASLVIMDEPTSSLTSSETELLFQQIQKLKEKNISIIYISHKLEEVFAVADEITVLRDGKLVKTAPVSEYTMDNLVTMMVGRKIDDVFPKENVEIGNTVLEVKNLTSKGVFENISFDVHAGEILGLTGLVGAGRTEVARAIFGLDRIDSGEIYLNGNKLNIKSPRDAIRQGITMASEDRKNVGLVLCRPISENISLATLDRFIHRGLISIKKEKKAVHEQVEKLHIKVSDINDRVDSLSGGNQQKVVLAKWLMGDIKVIIFDEPTRGIDVGSKHEIYKLIGNMAKQGIAIIVISSEMPEVLGISDRIAVMSKGKITGIMDRKDCTQEEIMRCAIANYLTNTEMEKKAV